MASSVSQTNSERWRKAHTGVLAEDFLRVISADATPQMASPANWTQPNQCLVPTYGRLIITCVQARLTRNYGITKMDPYVRVRVGSFVFETHTSPNGGKNPYWNRALQSHLMPGIKTVHVEIYDECSFKMDELIAWCDIPIPDSVLQGQTHEGSYALSGKQGEGQEGTIDIVLSYSLQPQTYAIPPATFYMGRNAHPLLLAPVQQPVYQPAPVAVPAFTEADFNQVKEMFPNMDEQVVRTVIEANQGNKAATINCLLQMNEQ